MVLFDFGLVQADDVRALPMPAAVLGNVVLFHNVTCSVIARRMLSGFVGLPMAVAGEPGLILPEGKVNPSCVALAHNPITAWDWKLNPSNRAVVVDADGLYQWTVATFGDQPEPGAKRVWYTSAVYGGRPSAVADHP